MYLTPVVRTIRDDPMPDESVTLLVRPADGAEVADLEADLRDAGASVLDRTRFGAVRVELPQPAVDDVCDLSGIEAVETADVTSQVTGDAGKDV